MLKKIIAITMCLLMVLSLSACKKNKGEESNLSTGDVSNETASENKNINPLTGLSMDESLYYNTPVAVVLENSKTVQANQTGHNRFDILYETIVEGGITRMLGITKNVEALGQVGNLRSAREVFLELAQGHSANLIHWGYDHFHFQSLKNKLDVKTIDLNSNAKYRFREQNGLSSEHTGYSTGESLAAAVAELGLPQTVENAKWISFNPENASKTPAGTATTVSVPFSGSYVTGFNYNAETGMYTKNNNGTVWTDWKTGETAEFKNVFVLLTTIAPHNCSDYNGDDKNHVKVSLDTGKGYYISNGGYEEITWKKGWSTGTRFVFTRADGTELSANAGKSYVCITKTDAAVSIS